MLRAILSAALTVLLFASNMAAAAADEAKCRVMDPTGTPLNVRASPNGGVIGNLPNDMLVSVIDRAVDRNGKPWVHISKYSDGKLVGWVFREFISCTE